MTFNAPRGLTDEIKLRLLYREAFPREERKPFSIIKRMQKTGKTDIWIFEEDGKFLGMATTINGTDKILVDYFAVTKKERGKGNGGRMLEAIIKHYLPRAVFLEIEIPYEDADNYAERKRRKSFYLSHGLCEIGTRAKLFGVDMELLGTGISMSFDEYRNFYLENYGRFAYDNIEAIEP